MRHSFRRQDADDLVHDVFVAALTRIDAGEPRDPQKLPGYVFGVCRNVILKGWDENRKRATVDADLSLFADLIASAEAQLIRELDARLVRWILQKLSTRDRDALNRIFFLEQDRATAAREMGTTTENLRLILCRALQRFSREWDNIQQKGLREKAQGA